MKKLEKFQTIFLVAGIGFFILSFVGMGLAPWTTLKKSHSEIAQVPRTPEAEAGRKIFMKEGCWHCHTQFVRPIAGEPLRYGPVSKAMEYGNEIPQLFGTRRVGPDLAREAGKRSNDWHAAHFNNPRSTSPWSVMPAFPWFSKEESVQLTAYMQSLGKTTAEPKLSQALLDRGKKLFAQECSGCHGTTGDGRGMALPFLTPAAANLTWVRPTPEYIFTVLNRGIEGSAMPAFHDTPSNDLWALAHYVQSLSTITAVAPKTAPTGGKKLFEALCVDCHGNEARGDGIVGAALQPPPPDFHGLKPAPERIGEALAQGVPGSAMPPFAQLTTEQTEALKGYILWLIQ